MSGHIKPMALIRSCSNSRYWYASRVGDMVDLHGLYAPHGVTQADGWRVWTGAEVNFIALEDAEIVPTRDGKRLHREELDHG